MSPVLSGTILCSICPKYFLHSIYYNLTYLEVYEPIILTYIFKMIFMKYVTMIRYLGVLSALPSVILWPCGLPGLKLLCKIPHSQSNGALPPANGHNSLLAMACSSTEGAVVMEAREVSEQ